MHHTLRSSLAVVALVACAGCQTHDRRIYSSCPDKNLHTPNPWAPSTTKAADDATQALGLPSDSANPSAPASPMPVPGQ